MPQSQSLYSDKEINSNICSLNAKQRHVFSV